MDAVNKEKKYHLTIESLGYNLITNSLSASKVSYIWIDTSETTIDSSSIIIPECSADGISVFNLIFNSQLSISDLFLDKPELIINEKKSKKKIKIDKNQIENDSLPALYRKIYWTFPDIIKPFKINQIIIRSGSYKLFRNNINPVDSINSINSMDLEINSFSIQSSEKTDSLSLMFCQSLKINMNGIYLLYPEDKYKASIKYINFSSNDSFLDINSFLLQPTVPDEDFFKGDLNRKDRLKISIPKIKLTGLNLSQFIWKKLLGIDNINLEANYLDILTNCRLPISPDFDPKMPHEIISEITFNLNVKRIDLKIDSILVKEFWPNYYLPSVLPFTKIEGKIYNISNISNYQSRTNPAVIDASSYLAGDGLLKVHLEIPLLSDGTDFFYKGSLGEMNANSINLHLIISDLVKVTSGKIDSINFEAGSDDGIVSAIAEPYYHNLKIKSIDKADMDSSGILIALETFIANTFKIRGSNSESDSDFKKGKSIYVKKKTDAFLDLIWLPLKRAIGLVVGFK